MTAIKGCHVGGDHFVLRTGKGAVAEMHAGGRVDCQHEIRPNAHRAQNIGDGATFVRRPNVRECRRNRTSRLCILDPPDPRHAATLLRTMKEAAEAIVEIDTPANLYDDATTL
jgi:hypothetical protein